MPTSASRTSPTPPPAPASSTTLTHAQKVFQALVDVGLNPKVGSIKRTLLAPYHRAAQCIPTTISLFCNLEEVIYKGLEIENDAFDGLDVSEEEEFTQDPLGVFKLVIGLIPNFLETLTEFGENPDHLTKLCAMMTKWGDSARSEDTSSLRTNSVAYMLRDPMVDRWDTPVPLNKADRGFHNKVTARLLCPQNDIPEFDNDPEAYMQSVVDEKIFLTAGKLCNFFYDEDALIDPDFPEIGFLKGHYVIRVYRSIFTGPYSGLHAKRLASKDSKAEIHGLQEVTPASIAYACVQARYSLTSQEKWVEKDGVYSYPLLYNFILAVFAEQEDWARETLEFWNSQVPGLQRKSRKRPRRAITAGDREERRDITELRDSFFASRRRRAQAERALESTDLSTATEQGRVQQTTTRIEQAPVPPEGSNSSQVTAKRARIEVREIEDSDLSDEEEATVPERSINQREPVASPPLPTPPSTATPANPTEHEPEPLPAPKPAAKRGRPPKGTQQATRSNARRRS